MNGLLLRLRDKGNTVLVVEHKPETIAIADHVVDLGPGAGTAGGTVCFEGTVDGLRASGTVTGRHLDDRAALKNDGAEPAGQARGPRRRHPQPARRRRRHPARGARRRHRRGRARARARWSTGRCPGGTGSCRSTRPRSAARGAATRPPTPGCSTRSAGRSPRPTGSSRRCSAPTPRAPARTATAPGVVYTDLAIMAGRRHHVRGVRREAVRRRRCSSTTSAAATSARCWRCRSPRPRSSSATGDARTPAAHADPRPARRRRARLPDRRPAADDAVRRRAPAAQAGHPHGRQGRRLRPRRADHRPAPGRRRAAARPARPAGRRGQVGHRHRAPPGGHGARRLDHRPRTRAPATTAAGSSSRARPADLVAARSTLTGEHLAAYVGA